MELVIASKNIHKIREFRSMLKGVPNLDLFSLLDFPSYVPPLEAGSTFEENAIQKALDAAKALNKVVLADDSGLVVPALFGRPGVFSSRFAGEDASDRENRQKLLCEMVPLKENQRSAFFECCIALAGPEGLKRAVHGLCEGAVLTEERGNQGFGYDPLFVKYDYSKSFAEMNEETKNRISHRRKALDKLLPLIIALAEKEIPSPKIQS
ncbi:MAG: non-canonical purine NTP pyrophosphatase, RdgB/HAM1 family [Chlamydiae bacterium GWC2_50_10]|nr:MAG: non-canonical purine NTP pyrophosphatase, RdgB/HAM1 family [Chlamydiae bacterium GWC2_50_10]OGN57338.1 MAG: non-canonical purine NTP pyrophosphatase, RdgB/HAM1 family [Chlamydiae bacterium RIFCSPHIGHO2_02_FULL_49_29]OGN68475.1 MAG: non-canonical purine NTP pyrophosphatase, RdgB/HAM1 family [Chlamydiae bacterium RIFCSPLOWO2_02_FULL_49_12]HCJ84146.1 non-canonical purine NTP pyrophosphatase, RdgB/HAM1 family [Parachlamydiales bacterium]